MNNFTTEERLKALQNSEKMLSKKMRILSLDDDPYDLMLAERVLSKFGEVTSVSDPKEGVKKLLTGQYDLAAIDLKLMGMTGAEVINRVQAVKPDQMFVIITGYYSDTICRDMLVAGRVQVRQKPITVESIRSLFR